MTDPYLRQFRPPLQLFTGSRSFRMVIYASSGCYYDIPTAGFDGKKTTFRCFPGRRWIMVVLRAKRLVKLPRLQAMDFNIDLKEKSRS